MYWELETERATSAERNQNLVLLLIRNRTSLTRQTSPTQMRNMTTRAPRLPFSSNYFQTFF